MSQTVHRLLAVKSADAPTAQELCKTLAPQSGDGMFISPYSKSGLAPVEYYISSGLIDSKFASILGNAPATFGAYQAAGGKIVTLAQVQSLYAGAIIRDDAEGYEQVVLDLLGLKPVATLI